MILTNVIAFPGNEKPNDRRATPATVVIFPVISVMRHLDKQPRMSPSQLARRLMNLRTMMRMDSV